MHNKLLSNQLLILFFSCSFLFSCSNPPTEENNAEETQQETSSETVQVDETKESDRGCPEKPGKLEASNVEKVSLDGNETTVSGQLTADEALGYAFEGKEEQKLSYSTDDEFCMWVLTPDNDVLEGLELPTDGSYVVQIAIPKGAKTFELAMELNNPEPLSESTTVEQPNINVQRTPRTQQAVPSSTSLERPEPGEFIENHYNAINQGKYWESWSRLPNYIKNDSNVHPQGYKSFESWFQKIKPLNVTIERVETTHNRAFVSMYYTSPKISRPQYLHYSLIWQNRKWNIESIEL